jgi:hypothetical protein
MKQTVKRLLAKIGRVMFSGAMHSARDLRTSPATKASLISLYAQLQSLAKANQPLPNIRDCGLRVFSQFEEDGYLLYLAAVLEIQKKIFVDIGSADGINSNCANLALNLGWQGLFIDGNATLIEAGRKFYKEHSDTFLYPPKFKHARITRENINDIIKQEGFEGEIGVISIDIDGNDYWVWEAVEVVQPIVVVIETHTEFGMSNIVVSYDANYVYPGKHPVYHGASPVAMLQLAHQKGYRLVGANRYGFNTVYVKRGVFEHRVPEVSLDAILQHPRYFERLALFESIKDWDYVQPLR